MSYSQRLTYLHNFEKQIFKKFQSLKLIKVTYVLRKLMINYQKFNQNHKILFFVEFFVICLFCRQNN